MGPFSLPLFLFFMARTADGNVNAARYLIVRFRPPLFLSPREEYLGNGENFQQTPGRLPSFFLLIMACIKGSTARVHDHMVVPPRGARSTTIFGAILEDRVRFLSPSSTTAIFLPWTRLGEAIEQPFSLLFFSATRKERAIKIWGGYFSLLAKRPEVKTESMAHASCVGTVRFLPPPSSLRDPRRGPNRASFFKTLSR